MNSLGPCSKEIFFKSETFNLRGFLHLPVTPPVAVVVGSHGFASTADSPKQKELSERCLENGIGFFRFDHRGCGKSDGIFSEVTSLEGRCADLKAAIETVVKLTNGNTGIALFGSSMGGAVVLQTAGMIKNIKIQSVITLAAPIRGSSIIKTNPHEPYIDDLPDDFYEKNLNFDISPAMESISNILVFHGGRDETVNVESAEEIYRLAKEPKKIIIQKNGDHRLSDATDIKSFMDAGIKWYKRCLQVPGK